MFLNKITQTIKRKHLTCWNKNVRNYAERKIKFYNEVNICKNEDGYEINLDQRKLRTPLGTVLTLPNEILAQIVASEWNSQTLHIKPHTMPMTTLCFSAADNPTNSTTSQLVKNTMHFLPTDTILYYSPEPPGIKQIQEEQWGEIINWVKNFFQVKLEHTEGFYPPPISKETESVLSNYLTSYKFWPLVGIERMTNTLKSVLLAIALIERRVTVEEAVSLSRLEQEFNISKWGNIEWHHDIELLETRSKVAASAIFIHACTEDYNTVTFRNHKNIV